MSGFAEITIVGRLGQDPEKKDVGDTSVCNFSVATSESYTKDGEKKERTEWHNLEVWGKLADVCSEYLKKGSQVFVKATPRTQTWETDSGEKRSKVVYRVSKVEFLGGKSED